LVHCFQFYALKNIMTKKAPKIPKIHKIPVKNDDNIKLKENINNIDKSLLPSNNILPLVQINQNRIIPFDLKTAEQIIIDISAQSNISINQIAVNNGINHYTLHYWKILNDNFATRYYAAMDSRQDVEVENIHKQIQDLLVWLTDNEELDAREKHVHIQALRLKMQNTHWTASKLSNRYRDTPLVQVNINEGGRRAAAWDRWQEIRAKK